MQGGVDRKFGRIRCAVLFPPRSETEDIEKSLYGHRKSGLIQISPTREGPWTTLRLNYGSPVACWRLGNDIVATEVSINDENKYVNIRSLVSVRNDTDFSLDLCLKLRAANGDPTSVHDEMRTSEGFESPIIIGPLKPCETIHLPLRCLAQSAYYVLHLKPSNTEATNHYSWSSVMDISAQSQNVEKSEENSEICVSTLMESDKLLYCSEISETSSSSLRGMWFCLSTQATEIAKDIHFDPIQDWTIVVKSPVSIANDLPFMAEISLLEMQASGHLRSCYRGLSGPGECVKVYNADIRAPLYFSLLPQRGWLPLHVSERISICFFIEKMFFLRLILF